MVGVENVKKGLHIVFCTNLVETRCQGNADIKMVGVAS